MLQVKIASCQKELEGILALRYEVLRKAWNQSIDSAADEMESRSINAYIQNETGRLIACGRLQENANKIGQIRFMAVDPDWQGKGLGKQILIKLEEKAKELGLLEIELQARETALDFYKNNDYSIKGKSFLLWGQIQHYLMGKKL